ADALIRHGQNGLSGLIKYSLQQEREEHLDHWSAYIVRKLPFEITTSFLADFLAPASSDKEILLALHLLCSIPSEDAWSIPVQRYISGDKFFRKRLRELIIRSTHLCLLRPFLKALNRVPVEIASEICEIASCSPDLDRFKILREVFLVSTDEQAGWIIKIMLSSNHPAKYQFLIDMLTREKRLSVRKEAIGILGPIREDAIGQVVFKLYMTTPDEEKIALLDLYRGKPGQGVVIELCENLTKIPKQQGFWVAKFLQKFITDYQPVFQECQRTGDPRLKEWMNFILK
ncbi:MAG: hypothetical protein PHQ23_14000, partial [Candidatus Wallbacteria bacterium]|nr:hypothetical protein [Candidatus Wallbacteria bacterium]